MGDHLPHYDIILVALAEGSVVGRHTLADNGLSA